MANNEIPRWAQAALERNERIQSKARSAVALMKLLEEQDRLSRLAPDTLGTVDPNYAEEIRYEAPGAIRDPESWLNRGLGTLAGNAADVILGRPSENPVVDYGVANIPGVGAAAILGAGGQPGLVDAAGMGAFFGGLGRIAKTAASEAPKALVSRFKGLGTLTPKQVAELEAARQSGKVPSITDPRHLPVVPYEMERMVLPEERTLEEAADAIVGKGEKTPDDYTRNALSVARLIRKIQSYNPLLGNMVKKEIAESADAGENIFNYPFYSDTKNKLVKEAKDANISSRREQINEGIRLMNALGDENKFPYSMQKQVNELLTSQAKVLDDFERSEQIGMEGLNEGQRALFEAFDVPGMDYDEVSGFLDRILAHGKNMGKRPTDENLKKIAAYIKNSTGTFPYPWSIDERVLADKILNGSVQADAGRGAVGSRAAEKSLAEFKRRQNQFTKKPDKALAEAQEQGISIEEWLGKPEGAEYNKQAQKLLEKYASQPAPKVEPAVEPVAEPVAVVEVPKKEVEYANPDDFYPEAFIDDEAEAIEAARRRNPNEALAFDLIDWDYDPDVAAIAKARNRGKAYDVARIADNIIKDEPTATAKVLLGGPNRWRENGWKSSEHNSRLFDDFGDNLSEESKRDIFVADSLAKHWAKNLRITDGFRNVKMPPRYPADPAKTRQNARHTRTNYNEVSNGFTQDLLENIASGNMPGKAITFKPVYDIYGHSYGYTGPVLKLSERELPAEFDNKMIVAPNQDGANIYNLLFRTRVDNMLHAANPTYWETITRW